MMHNFRSIVLRPFCDCLQALSLKTNNAALELKRSMRSVECHFAVMPLALPVAYGYAMRFAANVTTSPTSPFASLPSLSGSARGAIASINAQVTSLPTTPLAAPKAAAANKRKPAQLTKKELKSLEGHIRRYKLIGDRPEFHHVDRNKNNHIVEPTDKFQVVITTSKNNVYIQLNNRSRDYRTIFGSFAGNVGIYKAAQQTTHASERIALNVARKCKRLGITHVDVKFRRIMRIETCLKAFLQAGLKVTSLTHEPRLPKCGLHSAKARKRRRV